MTATASGQPPRIEGTGAFNGRPGYRFLLDAYDGGAGLSASPDRLRVRVTHIDAGNGMKVAYYDAAPATARRDAGPDGSVLIHGVLRLRQ